MEIPHKIQSVAEIFKAIPGVGAKSSLRMTLSLLERESGFLEKFSEVILGLKELHHCEECFAICDDQLCSVCANLKRDRKTICVVESFQDYLAIENSGAYHGVFHLLGGVLNPLLNKGPSQIRIRELVDRVSRYHVESLVLALNPSVEGDITCSYISDLFDDSIKIERIGFGIPIGGALEYVDALTIGKAFENKKSIK